MPATALAVNSYFKKRLTLAMSYSVTGVGLLPIVMPQICNFFLNHYGTKSTVLILGALSYHAFIGALLLRPIKKICNSKLQPLKNKELGSEKLLVVYNEPTTPVLKNNVKKRERVYVIIVIGMGISYVAELNFNLMAPFVLYELAGFSRTDVALATSIQATADISGRLFIPIISHRSGWSPKVMYAVSLAGSSVGRTVLALFCDTRNVVLGCFVLIGLSKGAKAVFQSLILPTYVSLDRLPSAMGFLMVINGVLSLIVGPVIGVVHDVGGSYVYALHAASLMSLFCIVLWTLDAYALKLKSKTVLEESIQPSQA